MMITLPNLMQEWQKERQLELKSSFCPISKIISISKQKKGHQMLKDLALLIFLFITIGYCIHSIFFWTPPVWNAFNPRPLAYMILVTLGILVIAGFLGSKE